MVSGSRLPLILDSHQQACTVTIEQILILVVKKHSNWAKNLYDEEDRGMHSRRNFLIRLLLLSTALLAPSALLKSLGANQLKTRGTKFMRQGWVLQEGDI
jgi:hypothetical protein